MFGFFGKDKGDSTLIIDVGSGSIGVALVNLGDSVPILKYQIRQDLVFQKDLNSRNLFSSTIKTLSRILEQYHRAGQPNPKRIYCYLSSHLSLSQTRIIRSKFETPYIINRSFVNNIVEKELSAFKNEHTGKYKNSSILIERKLMSLKLNGYSVSEIDNKMVHEIELSVFFTLMSTGVENEIRHIVADFFHHKILEFHSFLFANFATTRDLLTEEKEYVFIDIGSEISDFSVVRDGVLEASISFPLGKNSVIRKLLKNAGGEKVLLDSRLNIYNSNLLNSDDDRRFLDLLRSAGDDWMRAMEKAAYGTSTNKRLPQKFIVISDQDVSKIFKEFLSSLNLTHLTLFDRNPEITFLKDLDINKFIDNRSGIVGDPFLTIDALFLKKDFKI
ncbi:MAG: hypothetical protein HY225_02110 [Candidatus Vogelbacteria bacterium]|nr:hypothetical protein [Candidatus Vogelbacteria bacterium]